MSKIIKHLKEKIVFYPMSVLFLMGLTLQLLGYAFELIQNEKADLPDSLSVIANIFIQIKSTCTDNWIPVSLFVIFLLAVTFLYNSIKMKAVAKNKQEKDFILCMSAILNIVCAIDLTNKDKLIDKGNLIKGHWIATLVTVSAVLLFIIFIALLTKFFNAQRSKRNIHDSIITTAEEIKKADFKIKEDISQEVEIQRKEPQEEEPQSDEDTDEDIFFVDDEILIKHPFVSIFESKKFYYAKKKIDYYRARQKKFSESIEENADNLPFTGAGALFTVISSVIFLGVTVIAVYLWVKKSTATDGKGTDENIIENILAIIVDVIKALFGSLANGADGLKTVVLGFLMGIGLIMLTFISFIILVDTFTYMFVVWNYIRKNISKQLTVLEDFVLDIQAFFFGSLRGITRLLLFIPDFLETIEDTVFEFDIDDSIREQIKKDLKKKNSQRTLNEDNKKNEGD